jgi:hypothetical protein
MMAEGPETVWEIADSDDLPVMSRFAGWDLRGPPDAVGLTVPRMLRWAAEGKKLHNRLLTPFLTPDP